MVYVNRHLETLILTAFFIAVFLPVRLVFYTYISDYWLGSLGLITAILVIILYISKKDKMGFMGRLIVKKFKRIKNSKRAYYFIFLDAVMIMYYVLALAGIDHGGDPATLELMAQEYRNIDVDDLTEIEDMTAIITSDRLKDATIFDYVLAWILLVSMPFIAFDFWSSFVTQLDILADGWISHALIVWTVGSFETLAIVLYFKFFQHRHINPFRKRVV